MSMEQLDQGTALQDRYSQLLTAIQDSLQAEGKATSLSELLQEYLQLRTVLAETPLPNDVVQAFINKVEEEEGPFDDNTIQGDWQLVWQRNAKEATNSQKALAPLPQYSNFISDESGQKVFRNVVHLTKRRMRVVADVAYTAPAADSETPGRLDSTITAAGIELQLGKRFGWGPLRLPLPLDGKGWLEVTYLSDSMRITRGNRGGIFVHIRPTLLTREAVDATEQILA